MTVSELNSKAKVLLESYLSRVEVVGEISRLIKNQSGHWYFVLKDEKSSVNCAMFKGINSKLKFTPSDGMKVVIVGKVSLYEPTGAYQIIVSTMHPEGEGEIEAGFRQLKEKLEKEGLFDNSHKKPLPEFPKKIAIITSVTSAAFADIQKVAASRWKLTKIDVYHSTMQGENAATSIIKQLQIINKCEYDAIIITRGGGSKEDLWCFNDEALARAVYLAKIPVVSAIGHEIDYCILDFVSDYRSHTPTQAMTDVLPDENELFQSLDMTENKLNALISAKINTIEKNLFMLSKILSSNEILKRIRVAAQKIKSLVYRFDLVLDKSILKMDELLKLYEAILSEKQKFLNATKDFVSISLNNKKVELSALKSGDEVLLSSQECEKKAIIK